MKLNILVLFSGTKSLSKSFNNYYKKNSKYEFNIRTLDIEKKFNPTYCVDILKFDYKNELKDFIPDYIHSSPLCKEFSQVKTLSNHNRDLTLGYSLLDKSIEIINYFKNINPNLFYTIENPRNKFFKQRCLDNLDDSIVHKTSYCKYDFKYQKITLFVSNHNLDLERFCSTKYPCKFFKENRYHQVVLCYNKNPDKYPKQIKDSQYLKVLRSQGHKIRNLTCLRYRIPQKLLEKVIDKFISHIEEVNKKISYNLLEDIISNVERLELENEDKLEYIDYE